MLTWTPVITEMSSTTMTAAITAKFSRITITITKVTSTSIVMEKLNPQIMFTILVTNFVVSISMVVKIDKIIARWLSHSPYTCYNFICSKLILKFLCRNSGIQLPT